MRSIVVRRFGGPDVLEVATDAAVPVPAPGQVRIRVEASPIHPVDIAARTGAVAGIVAFDLPYVLGWDMAGTVDAVGDGVDRWRPGDRVIGMSNWFVTGGGTNAEYVVFDADWLAAAPQRVTAAEAAALPVNGLTAMQALDLLDLSAGDALAVTGAAGQVGGFAVQIAASRGLKVTAVAGPDDESLMRQLGADNFVARSDDVVGALRAAMPDGFDGVIDAAVIGSAALGAVRDGGAVAGVNSAAVPQSERGIRVGAVRVQPDGARMAELAAAVDRGELTPRVAATYPFEQATDAHRLMDKGGLRGRLVLVP